MYVCYAHCCVLCTVGNSIVCKDVSLLFRFVFLVLFSVFFFIVSFSLCMRVHSGKLHVDQFESVYCILCLSMENRREIASEALRLFYTRLPKKPIQTNIRRHETTEKCTRVQVKHESTRYPLYSPVLCDASCTNSEKKQTQKNG